MDEPCSALDPISTLKIEELIEELKSEYTIVIVTHNMQQAARVSDVTAFFYLGRADRGRGNPQDFYQPGEEADGRLHHRQIRVVHHGFKRFIKLMKPISQDVTESR